MAQPQHQKPPPKRRRRPTSEMSLPTGVELIGEYRYLVLTSCPSWEHFVDTYAAGLLEGRAFVECLCPPVPGSTVELRIGLPRGARDLILEGEVTRVREPKTAFVQGAGPGFGMRLRISDEDRQRLHEIVAQARSASAAHESPTGDASSSSSSLRLFVPADELDFIAELEHELDEIEKADDRTRLGLPTAFDSEMVYLAFYARSQHWKTKSESMSMPEIPGLVSRIVSILEGACARLSAVADFGDSVARPTARPEPAKPKVTTPEVVTVVSSGRVTGPTIPVVASTAPAEKPKRPSRSTPKPAAVEPRAAAPREARAPEPVTAQPKPERDEPMNEVAQLLRGRKYNEALALLRKALQSTGSSPRVNTYRVWISFIEARKFAAAKDFDTAVEKYQAVLDLDPNHAAAQREILMARCMLK